jgi:hypothetical protein
MKQLTLDTLINVDVCARNHMGNPESVEAHNSIKSSKAAQWNLILSFLAERGDFGATAEEIQKALGMRQASTAARCSELKAAGKVRVVGRRKTSSGRKAAVLSLWNS